MTLSLDSLLSNLASTYKTPEVSQPAVQAKRPMKKLRQPEEQPSDVPPRIFCAVPQVGYYDAKGFLVALRNAKTRDEQIACIAGFRGYDAKLDFGSNEYLAKSLAQRELTPSLTVNASPRIPSSVKGYVAGMPNDHTKRVMDLTARYKLAIDTAIDYEKIAASEAEPQDVRDFNAGLALLERERAAQIEKDLAALG